MRVSAFVFSLVLLSAPAWAQDATFDDFEWRWEFQDERIDLTHDALMGSKGAFFKWRSETQDFFRAKLAAYPMPTPSVSMGTETDKGSYKIIELNSAEGDGLLAVPNVIDPSKPVIIALHGHESSHRGDAPYDLFDSWAGAFASDGYVVYAPAHLFYDRDNFGSAYHIHWTRRVSELLDASKQYFPAHSGLAAVGLSSGGHTGPFLMAARNDIEIGVFAGSLISLDWLRENAKHKTHPSHWDIPWLNNYATLYALMAPRPVMWQLGRQDNFWPHVLPKPAPTASNPGYPRMPESVEVWGAFLTMQHLWGRLGGDVSLHAHDGGHEVDYAAARGFIEAHHVPRAVATSSGGSSGGDISLPLAIPDGGTGSTDAHGLGGQVPLPPGNNLNNVVSTGWSRALPDTLNAPSSGTWTVETMVFSPNASGAGANAVQVAHRLNGNMHIRAKNNGAWGAWRQVSVAP